MSIFNITKIILLCLISVSSLLSQPHRKKWVIISDIENRIIYIDTTTITSNNDQISLWSLTKYRKAIDIQPFQQKIARVQSNYLFDTYSNKYSIIGAIYFDKMGKIIGQSNNPNITTNKRLFINKIESGSIHEILLREAQHYLQTGTLTTNVSENNRIQIERSQSIPSLRVNQANNLAVSNVEKEVTREDSIKISVGVELKKDLLPLVELESQSVAPYTKTTDNAHADIDINDQAEKKSVGNDLLAKLKANGNREKEVAEKPLPRDENINPYSVVNNTNNGSNTKSLETKKPKKKYIPPKIIKAANYNTENESIAEGNIWTDGNLYCVQHSSWKSQAKANQVAKQFKNRGFNAFVVKAFVKKRNRNYYRVRIGYFGSLNSARNEAQKLR